MKKRWWILACFAFLPFLWGVVFQFSYRAKFNRRVEILASKGFPVSLEDLEKAHVLPAGVQNAADIYLEAFSYYQEPDELEYPYLPIRGDFIPPDDKSLYPQQVMKAIESSVIRNQKMLDMLEQAAAIEYCLWPHEFDTLEDLYFPEDYSGGIVRAAMLLCEHSLYDAQRRKTDQFANHFQTLKALSNSLSQNPILNDYLIAIRIKSIAAQVLEEVLNRVEMSDTELRSLRRQFLEMQDVTGYYHAMLNARCVVIVEYRLPLREYFEGTSYSLRLKRSLYLLSGMAQKDKLTGLDFYDLFLQTGQCPPEQLPGMIEKIMRKFEAYSAVHLYLNDLYNPAEIAQKSLQTLGRLRCAETALAVERYRLAKGELPESLEDLVPVFMSVVPLDPFDGEPLRYIRRDEGGYTLYCIGDDWVDNGGLSQSQMAEQTGEADPEDYDWPFTVRR